MLVVTRKEGQAVVIDGRYRVIIVKIGEGRRVRVGFDVPADVPVDREEVHLSKMAEVDEDRRGNEL